MPGTLYVVATPIGNLEDVTLRALRVLREVALIAAEDTRRTARLLQHYSIPTPTTSLHEHNENARTPGLIRRLQEGDSIALVSDAGTPVVSDPGARLVAAAHAQSIRVEPIPGPSAVVASLSASGIVGDGFLFAGFPPIRAKARKTWFESLAKTARPVVLFEAPHRIQRTLEDLQAEFGERLVAVAREITKAHETLAVRPISAWVREPPIDRGEFTLVIAPTSTAPDRGQLVPSDTRIAELFGQMTNNGHSSRREVIRRVAEALGLSSRNVFDALERHKMLGE